MDVPATVSEWLPESPPSRSEILWAAAGIVLLALNLSTVETISWAAFAAGFVAVAFVAGPVAKSSLGDRINSRAPAAGTTGRAASVVLAIVALWVVILTVDVPATVFASAGSGILLAAAVLVAFRVAYTGGVSG